MAESIEDLNLPNAVVGRLIKDALPENASISKEARMALTRTAAVFVLYLTSAANNAAKSDNHRTMAAKYVFDALEEIEFESFIAPLKENLEAFRKNVSEKKTRKSVNPSDDAQKAEEDGDDNDENTENVEGEDEEQET